MIIVEVALPLPIKNNFFYSFPKSEICPVIGSRVIVPFNNSQLIGIIVSINNNKTYSFKLKKIISIIDQQSIFTPSTWNLILWCTDYYQCHISFIIFNFIPYLLKKGKTLKKKCATNVKLLKKVIL
ncbi:hypothetical protein [Buchnera aphidicola]|uniref:primosomal protein N' family DNA-binding protein n=1 Tax=Buchnera aphidicola TaxID=9 RepID=UPI00130E1882|nr:hypothetical protein [Buchnera aphidicola]